MKIKNIKYGFSLIEVSVAIFIVTYTGVFSLWTQRSMNYVIPLFKHCELCVTQFPYWLSVLMTVFLSPVIGVLNIIIEILRFFL